MYVENCTMCRDTVIMSIGTFYMYASLLLFRDQLDIMLGVLKRGNMSPNGFRDHENIGIDITIKRICDV
jgi:hypothetical protein